MRVTDKSSGMSSVEKQGNPVSTPSRWIQRLGRSISAKLMVSIFVILIIIFSLFGYFSIRDQRKHLEDAALLAAERQSEVLRRSASHYMLNNDRNGLYEMMLNMADQPGMVRVRIMNPQGMVSFSTAPSEVGAAVDKSAEACYGCHEKSMPLTPLNRTDRFRIYRAGGERVLGVIHAYRERAGVLERLPAPCSSRGHASSGRAGHQHLPRQGRSRAWRTKNAK